MGMFDSFFGGGSNVSSPDPRELIRLQEEYNQVNTSTPYGGITYTKDGPKPMGYDEWFAQNPGPRGGGGNSFQNSFLSPQAQQSHNNYDPGKAYGNYVSDFEANSPQTTTANFNYSPELQGIFDKQFDPNAYDNYKDDYMGNYYDLMEPGRTRQMDQFQQSMFDRGAPEGGDIYGDIYRTTVGDPNSRQDVMAAGQAQQMSDVARLQDYNRLMAAMGGSQLPIPGIDIMAPYNMQLNADMGNASNDQAQESSMWNTGALLGAAAIMAPAASDRRLKTNIKRIGTAKGYPWYSFDYIWGESSEGVMSDEINQDAVFVSPSGYDVVDYARIR